MIAELGLFSLIWAFLFALLLVIVPTIGLLTQRKDLIQSAPQYVYGQVLLVGIAYACLTICFLRDDFSVLYVLTNSSRDLPFFYKLCAVWGGHEGSMLLWVLILSAWTLAVSLFSYSLNEEFRTRVLVVLGLLAAGFILFLLMTSNPFIRQFQWLNHPGKDLNPLLQDIGFLFHPPMLYMGYVGFSVTFAFAIASLWMGKMDSSWTKWTRPWTMAAWLALTLGITLGSWWAYRELGWGGFWFWDPVENASFMPWLVGTALIHSMAVSEKREVFKAWTLLLAIIAFSLSLIGTFLVRSGVLTSVHAFAVDPGRGLYILIFLSVVIGSSLLLFGARGSRVIGSNYTSNDTNHTVSRENALFLNNILLIVSMLTVLLGTIYPLIIDGLNLGKLSVGAPYFNTVLTPLFIALLVLMGFGLHINWRQDTYAHLFRKVRWVVILSILLPTWVWILLKLGQSIWIYLGLMSAVWALFSTVLWWVNRIKNRAPITQALYGMLLAHCGSAITAIGISISIGFGLQDDVKLSPSKQISFAGYTIRFISESDLIGPNYHGVKTEFLVSEAGHQVRIFPEKRIYNAGKMTMTEAAIDVTPFRDVYIALGEPLDNESWSVRLYYKPLVRWIWGGGFLIALGGLLALTDRRYYKRSLSELVDH